MRGVVRCGEMPGKTKAQALRNALVLVAGLVLACMAHPAFALRFSPTSGCDELCAPAFWNGAGVADVAVALDENPAALPYRRTMLWLAVQAENAGAVAALLRTGAPPNSQKEPASRDLVLHEAARRSGTLVSMLLEAGAFPNVSGEGGRTPLHEAVRWGRTDAALALLEAGANPGAPDDRGVTPLDLAYSEDDTESRGAFSVKREQPPTPPCRSCRAGLRPRLLAPPPPPQCGALCDAEFWQAASVEEARDALAQAPDAKSWRSPEGGPLHLALTEGTGPEIVELLLDHGADPDGRDARDDTALHVAARTPGGAESVALLLERGAMRDALNEGDRTPLHEAAARAPTIENMRVLLDAGADPDSVAGDTFAVTPRQLAVSHAEGADAAALILHYRGTRMNADIADVAFDLLVHAAAQGHPDTVELLIRQGAEVNGSDMFGATALRSAAYAGNHETMRALMRHGADPNDGGWAITAGEQEHPLHAAIGHPTAVALLLEFGADPNRRIPYAYEMTPVHRAARKCAGASLALLLEHGADPNARNRSGETPLHYAIGRLFASRDSDSIKGKWAARCASEERQKSPGWRDCRKRAATSFRDDHEAREECTENIATLIEFGANPRIAATNEDGGEVSALDLAGRYRLSESIVRLLEDAAWRRGGGWPRAVYAGRRRAR